MIKFKILFNLECHSTTSKFYFASCSHTQHTVKQLLGWNWLKIKRNQKADGLEVRKCTFESSAFIVIL